MNGKAKFINTIGFRLIGFLILMVLAVLTLLRIFGGGMVKQFYHYYYMMVLNEAHGLAIQIHEMDALPEEQLSMLGEDFKIICDENNIMAIYLVKVVDGGESGQCIAMSINGTVNEGLEDYEYSDYEKEIGTGKKSENLFTYETQKNGRQMVYLEGIYNENGECKYILGLSVAMEDYDEMSQTLFLRIYGPFTLVLLISFGIVFIFLRVKVTHRLSVLSGRMVEFSQTDESRQLSYTPLPEKGKDEIAIASSSFNQMASNLIKYVEETKENEIRLAHSEAENKISYQIQQGFLPKKEICNSFVSMSGMMKPARYVGGDFYTYELLEDGTAFMAIGDVSGKGVSAALMMSSVITALKMNAQGNKTPAQILDIVNRHVYQNNPENMFVTIFVAIYDYRTGMLTYSNAGHNPPYLVGDSGIRKLDDNRNLLIGLFDDAEYVDSVIQPQIGERLFLYTDGVTEAVNKDAAFFGTEALEEILMHSTENIIEEIMASLSSYMEGAVQHDDITLLCTQFCNRYQKTFPARLNQISLIRDVILNNPGIPKVDQKKLYVACEEIFVNICTYAYQDSQVDEKQRIVDFKMSIEDNTIVFEFRDGGIPFDPTKDIRSMEEEAYDPDLEMGGLGRFLANGFVDQMDYRYEDGKNILTMRKRHNNLQKER